MKITTYTLPGMYHDGDLCAVRLTVEDWLHQGMQDKEALKLCVDFGEDKEMEDKVRDKLLYIRDTLMYYDFYTRWQKKNEMLDEIVRIIDGK